MKYRITTEGMGCPRCMAKVTKAMEALGAEVTRMELNDFDIVYDGGLESVAETITALGFAFVSAEVI